MEPSQNNLSMAMIKPFGPSIVKVKLPDFIVSRMNAYVDNIITDQTRAKELDHGPLLAGNVTQEFLLEPEFLEEIKWRDFIGLVCNEWLKRTSNRELKQLEMIRSWVVRQFENEYNPVHHHSGHVSGVGYLKVPRDMGKTFQENKVGNRNGNLVFIYGAENLFSRSTFEVRPEVGDFYLFPNYLQHAVYPFRGTDEERRSVSFNARFDEASAAY